MRDEQPVRLDRHCESDEGGEAPCFAHLFEEPEAEVEVLRDDAGTADDGTVRAPEEGTRPAGDAGL